MDKKYSLAEVYMKQLGVKSGETILIDSRAVDLSLAENIAQWLQDNGCKSIIVDHSKPALMKLVNSGDSHEEMQEKLKIKFDQADRRFVIFDSFQPNPEGFDGAKIQGWATNVFVPVQKISNEAGKPWLLVSPPSEGFAAAVGMDHNEFFDYYLDACCVDYPAMKIAAEPLSQLFINSKEVHIKSGEHTDITFQIVDHAEICCGQRNFPDGECFTAPVKDSINGKIKFGPSKQQGTDFPWIQLTFENGKIVEATSATKELTDKLNEILDTDEGARYIGEFAIAFNPNIHKPVGNILFDEKIAGSLHFAIGRCLPETSNGNASGIHWDLVQIQTPEHGGGEIYIDDRLIRKNGIFVVPELAGLNPENLLGTMKKTPARTTKMAPGEA